MKAAGVSVLMLALVATAAAFTAAAHHPPRPRPSLARCAAPVRERVSGAVAPGPAKPSSYAPQPRARSRSYGAPIQRPIVTKHRKHKTRAGSHRGSSAQADRRSG